MKGEKEAHHSSSSRGSPQPIQGDTVEAGHSTTRICRTASGPPTSPVLHHPSPDLPPVNHYRITIRSTDEQNCICWNPGTQQAYNHSARPVKQPPSVFRSLTDHPPFFTLSTISLSDFMVRRETTSNTVRPTNGPCSLLLTPQHLPPSPHYSNTHCHSPSHLHLSISASYRTQCRNKNFSATQQEYRILRQAASKRYE